MFYRSKKNIWEKGGAWCLILTAGFLPWVMYLHLYDNRVGDESWYPGEDGLMADFFQYGKSQIFLILSVVMAVLLIWHLRDEQKKKGSWKKEWVFLIGIGVTYVLSTVFSVDRQVSLLGNYGRFETVFVLLGYLILCCFSWYQAENTAVVQLVLKVLFILSAGWIFLGFLQITGCDPIFSREIQKIIIPHSLWTEYLGKLGSILKKETVYLTLGNPNTASMYLAMLMILLFGLYLNGEKRKKIFVLIVESCLFANLILTFSRVGILMLAVALVIGVIIKRKSIKTYWKKCILAVFFVLVGFLIIDSCFGFRFLERIYLTGKTMSRQEEKLTSIETGKKDIKITYAGDTLYLTYQFGYEIEDGALRLYDEQGNDVTEQFSKSTGVIERRGWEDIFFFISEIDEEQFLTAIIEDEVWNFTYVDGIGYMIYTGNGKYDIVGDIAHTKIGRLGHVASGRPYIWSRTLPLLRQYGIFGSGPDTFYQVFPQNDYVGKANYASSNLTVIEKPHCTYLLTALQNGILSLLLFFCFLGYYLINSVKILKKTEGTNEKTTKEEHNLSFVIFLMILAYLAGCVFNDSNLCVSPLFYMMLGFGIRLNEKQGLYNY